MSSYAQLLIRGREVFSFRNEIDPTFLLLFTRDNLKRLEGPAARAHSRFDPDYDDQEFAIFTASVFELRERLDALGLGRSSAAYWYADLRNDQQERADDPARPEVLRLHDIEEARFWDGRDFSAWANSVRSELDAPSGLSGRFTIGSIDHLLSLWEYVDHRIALRAILEALDPDEIVELDVSELIEGGWLDDPFDPQAIATESFSYIMSNGTPPIILTEGSTDVHALQQAVQVLKPHLATYLRFFDFSVGIDGGAAALLRTVRAFAGAGIANRVVAIFDNDTAAQDVLRTLDRGTLPSHFLVLQYPDLPLAREYPTIGPSGETVMNVNGMAAALELYMGRDSLTDDNGELRRVQWTGYAAPVGAYQGEVLGKAAVRRHFLKKVETALADPSATPNQDWTGMTAILDMLLDRLGEHLESRN